MSRIDDLIAKYCPGGVKRFSLSSLGKISIGEFVHKNKQNPSGEYPVFNGGTSNTGFYDEYNNTGNKIIISARGANAGFVNRIFVNYWAGNSCYTIEITDGSVDWNYVYYVLKKDQLSLIGQQQTGGIPAISKKQIENLQIPVPPLPVQQEIVRILDSFSELEKELEKELETREKQYEYYRNQLLSFGERGERTHNVKWAKLGDVLSFKRGIRVVKAQLSQTEGYPVFQNSLMPLGFFEKYNCAEKTVFIIMAGAAGGIGYSNERFWAADDCYYFENQSDIIARYLYHVLMSRRQFILSGVRKASIPRLSKSFIEKIQIPIPPLPEQERIVAILDKFDELVNDISIGLPAEIDARLKQYEYYRNKLLTFPMTGDNND